MAEENDTKVLEIAKDIEQMLLNNKPDSVIADRIKDLQPYAE